MVTYPTAERQMLPDAFEGQVHTQTITPEFLEHHIPEHKDGVDRVRYAIERVEKIYNVVGGFVYDSGHFHVFFIHAATGDSEAAERAAQELFHWIDKG